MSDIREDPDGPLPRFARYELIDPSELRPGESVVLDSTNTRLVYAHDPDGPWHTEKYWRAPWWRKVWMRCRGER